MDRALERVCRGAYTPFEKQQLYFGSKIEKIKGSKEFVSRRRISKNSISINVPNDANVAGTEMRTEV